MESLGYLNDSLTTLIKPHAVTDADGARALEVPSGEILFKDVHFEYEQQKIFAKLNNEEPRRKQRGIGSMGLEKSKLSIFM